MRSIWKRLQKVKRRAHARLNAHEAPNSHQKWVEANSSELYNLDINTVKTEVKALKKILELQS